MAPWLLQYKGPWPLQYMKPMQTMAITMYGIMAITIHGTMANLTIYGTVGITIHGRWWDYGYYNMGSWALQSMGWDRGYFVDWPIRLFSLYPLLHIPLPLWILRPSILFHIFLCPSMHSPPTSLHFPHSNQSISQSTNEWMNQSINQYPFNGKGR